MSNGCQLYGVDVIAGLLVVALVVGQLTDLLELEWDSVISQNFVSLLVRSSMVSFREQISLYCLAQV